MASGHQLYRGNQDVEGLGVEGDGRAEFDFHDGKQGAPGISGQGSELGERETLWLHDLTYAQHIQRFISF